MLSAAPLAAPGALVVYLAFSSGGFFPTAPALVAIGLAIFLVLRLTLAAHPLAGVSPALGVTAAALGLFAAWTLLSGTWGTPARALLEYDRVLAYLLALVAFGSMARTPERLAWMVRLLTLGIAGVAAAALTTWLLPEVWSVAPGAALDRLSYPLTYWNALGLLCALGSLFALHLTTSGREPPAIRVLAAAAMPLLVVTLFLTFSRGAIAAGLAGVVVLLVATRPRGIVSGLVAVAPACVIALRAAYEAEALSGAAVRSAEAVSQGHDVAVVVAAAMVGAAIVRAIGLWLDAWLERRAATRQRWPVARIAALWAAALALGVTAGWRCTRPTPSRANTTASSRVTRRRASTCGSAIPIPATTVVWISGAWPSMAPVGSGSPAPEPEPLPPCGHSIDRSTA